MKTLRVNIPGKEYDIRIGEDLLKSAPELIKSVSNCDRVAVVTDSNVEPLYAVDFKKRMEESGFEVRLITIPAGETSKSPEMLMKIYNEALDFKITRTDLIIALGGGVVGDIAGYAAATLLRGIPYVQIPTTLLAQVDSSVGGKVAIDLPQGKNLVGAFNQPKMVVIDPLCLKTLDDRILCDGMAEVIKYGAIKDKKLFELLESIKSRQELFAKVGEIIYNCCDIKRQVVEEDEFDTGGRMILNFGHTFGHAIEKQFNYETYTHGEGVAAGMVMASRFGEKTGVTEPGTADRIVSILKNYDLPCSVELENKELAEAVAVDKKGVGKNINLILLKSIGDVLIKPIEKSEFLRIAEELESDMALS